MPFGCQKYLPQASTTKRERAAAGGPLYFGYADYGLVSVHRTGRDEEQRIVLRGRSWPWASSSESQLSKNTSDCSHDGLRPGCDGNVAPPAGTA